MKKILMFCLFLIGTASISYAQSVPQKLDPAAKAKELQKQLKLSTAQTAKITAIFKGSSAKLDSIKTASKGDKTAVLQGVKPLREATNAKVKKVLTPAQGVGYDKLMKEKAGTGGNGWGQ